MKQKFINALVACGFVEGKTCFLQGTHNPAEPYPETFVTFWTNSTADSAHYDDDTHSIEWAFTVILYSKNPVIVNTKPYDIRAKLKAAGFIPQGRGQDVPSDEPTHTGWAMDFIGIEIL